MITKVKNFEGYWLKCSRCGRDIKHAYRYNNSKEMYGSECVYAISGIYNFRENFHKANDKILARYYNKDRKTWDKLKDAYKMTDDQFYNFCMTDKNNPIINLERR